MNIFDVAGPITLGPSSSHTAGIIRIGNIYRKLILGKIRRVEVTFYGSLAETFYGHRSHLAIIGGILGFREYDERIRKAFQYARQEGLLFSFKIDREFYPPHPVSLKISGESNEETLEVIGVSPGGGVAEIHEIWSFPVLIRSGTNTVLVLHRDTPGLLSKIAARVFAFGINIGTAHLTRMRKGGEAILVLELDDPIDERLVKIIEKIDEVMKVRTVARGEP